MKRLTLPCKKEELKDLVAGEKVLLSGTVYTARDAAHKKLDDLIKNNQLLPLDLKNQSIYYTGPTQTPPNATFGSAGPTTSTRMDAYTEMMLDQGVQVFIGKGKRSPQVQASLLNHGAVYFVAVGGAGALLGQCVVKAECIAFEELQSEAIRRLEIKDFPVFVGVDTKGKDIYSRRTEDEYSV